VLQGKAIGLAQIANLHAKPKISRFRH